MVLAGESGLVTPGEGGVAEGGHRRGDAGLRRSPEFREDFGAQQFDLIEPPVELEPEVEH